MKVRLLKWWHHQPVGAVIEIMDGVGNVLVRRGIAVEAAVLDAAETAAMAAPVKRARGRPRKNPQ